MSTVRLDPLTGQSVVVAPKRIPALPAFGRGRLPEVARCPFCPGAEDQTGLELGRVPRDGAWSARAFPNRRPGLHLETDRAPLGSEPLSGHGGRGAHEVIALGRTHGRLTEAERHAGLLLASERLADLARDPGFAALGWFRNRGLEAGSSQPHDHAQIVAMASVPSRLQAVCGAQREDPQLLDTVVRRARAEGRLVAEQDGVVAYCPWAPVAPFAVRLQPVGPVARWADAPELLAPLAGLLHRLQEALDDFSGFTSTNSVAWFPPLRRPTPGLRWVVEVVPRVVPLAGFERWSGGAMHPTDPEVAAAMLRDAVA